MKITDFALRPDGSAIAVDETGRLWEQIPFTSWQPVTAPFKADKIVATVGRTVALDDSGALWERVVDGVQRFRTTHDEMAPVTVHWREVPVVVTSDEAA